MSRPRLRTRLTLLHAALTFVCCAILVVLTALLPLLTARSTVAGRGEAGEPIAETNLPDLLRDSAYVLVSLVGISLAVGWLIAGRALRPLDVITASARELSVSTLDGRLRAPAAYREFTELADTLESLRKRLHESFTAQRHFIANASHELRTPLTVQRTLLQLTLADPEATADTFRSACRELLDLGRQQEDLIDALLTLARGHQGIDHGEQFDLADLTRKVVADHAAETEQRGVRVHTELAPTTVVGDARLAVSLITNLVANALRHNVPGGSIEITTSEPGRLTVGNTGPVIPPSKVGRLFQPFQRLGPDRLGPDRHEADCRGSGGAGSTSVDAERRAVDRGHGLGLAIVAAIADAHRASVVARPRIDGGLDIAVDFPARADEPGASMRQETGS